MFVLSYHFIILFYFRFLLCSYVLLAVLFYNPCLYALVYVRF